MADLAFPMVPWRPERSHQLYSFPTPNGVGIVA